VKEFLEGVGSIKPPGIKLPYIAVPTTSGTGSEATKNAVITKRGRDGFKKSLRHDNYVPEMAIIDPEFMLSCPKSVTAASGMDTLSQLIESYISTGATPLTEALALEGLKLVSQSLPAICNESSRDVELRGKMALASYISGITLANAGLGTVHGIAGPMGGMFDIPHGVACANLLPGVLGTTIERMKAEMPENPLLVKLGRLGFLFGRGREVSLEAVETLKGKYEVFKGLRLLEETLSEWLEVLEIPPLSSFGISRDDVDTIAEKSGNKNNPVPLSKREIAQIVEKRL
jgi:alcohol dehydrogenase class IV